MPALIQTCIVIVTVGLLAIALMMVRLMARFNRASEELSQLTRTVRESVVRFGLVADETQALVTALRGCVPPVQRVVDRCDAVSLRAADLSSTLLAELETPVFVAAALARGVRSGANHLMKRILNRWTHPSPLHGGHDHD